MNQSKVGQSLGQLKTDNEVTSLKILKQQLKLYLGSEYVDVDQHRHAEKRIYLEQLSPNLDEIPDAIFSPLVDNFAREDFDAYDLTRTALQLSSNYPGSTKIYNLLGVLFMHLGAVKETRAYLSMAVWLSPDLPEARKNLGITLFKEGNYQAAFSMLEAALLLDPDSTEIKVNLGVVLDKIGDSERAVKLLEEAVSVRPDYLLAKKNAGNIYYTKRAFSQALRYLSGLEDRRSVAQRLECLFCLGHFDQLATELRSLRHKDPYNVRAAALSSLLANQLGCDDVYGFCGNPLDFVKKMHLSDFDPDWSTRLRELLGEMDQKELIWEPDTKTTRKGFQTIGNLLELSSERVNGMFELVDEAVKLYHEIYRFSSCRYITDWPKQRDYEAWYVKLHRHGYQDSHIHPSGWLSGVIYLKTLPQTHSNDGAIELSLSGYKLPTISEAPPQRTISPSCGDILLFPSSLFHKTIPFNAMQTRSVIAFDLQPSHAS